MTMTMTMTMTIAMKRRSNRRRRVIRGEVEEGGVRGEGLSTVAL